MFLLYLILPFIYWLVIEIAVFQWLQFMLKSGKGDTHISFVQSNSLGVYGFAMPLMLLILTDFEGEAAALYLGAVVLFFTSIVRIYLINKRHP